MIFSDRINMRKVNNSHAFLKESWENDSGQFVSQKRTTLFQFIKLLVDISINTNATRKYYLNAKLT